MATTAMALNDQNSKMLCDKRSKLARKPSSIVLSFHTVAYQSNVFKKLSFCLIGKFHCGYDRSILRVESARENSNLKCLSNCLSDLFDWNEQKCPNVVLLGFQSFLVKSFAPKAVSIRVEPVFEIEQTS